MFLILDLQSLLLKARKLHQNKFIFGRNFWDFKIIVKSDKQSILNTSHTLNSFEAKMGSCSLQFLPTPTIVFHTKLQDWQILFLPSSHSYYIFYIHLNLKNELSRNFHVQIFWKLHVMKKLFRWHLSVWDPRKGQRNESTVTVCQLIVLVSGWLLIIDNF